jgi:hypothetical protein
VAHTNGASPARREHAGRARKANALVTRKPSSRTTAQAQDARRDWAKRIRATWAKTIAAIIETGKQLNAAKADLPHGEFQYLVHNETPFHWSTADRLMAISRHEVLSNFAHAQSLPAHWSTLYELSRLRPKRLLALIKDHTVSARMERQDAEKLVAREIERIARVTQPPTQHVSVSPTVVHTTKRIISFGYRSAQPDDVDDVRPDTSEPTEEVPAALREIAAQASGIIEPPIDRLAVLVAAWGAAGESDRRRFLDHIGARLEIEIEETNGDGRDTRATAALDGGAS